MSLNNFISYLQQILTMVDPKDKYSIALAKSALMSTIALAEASGKVDFQTQRAMRLAEMKFEQLVENAADYAGKPGKYEENERKRNRLKMSIACTC